MSRLFRGKCACGHVVDLPGSAPCPKCGRMINLSPDGIIQIYRMGSPIGIAAGYGIYINGTPCGHLANKETIRIPVSYGTYTLHFTCGVSRRCRDLTVQITPQSRVAYVKARIQPGFWTNTLVAEPAAASEMPPV